MALARNRRGGEGFNYWPGFVDALSTLILAIIFLLSVFVVVQFFLSQEVSGKDKALERLNAQIAQLNELLSLEKLGKLNLDEQLSQMRAGLAAAESERDRVKGLYQGLAAQGSDAAGRAGELSKALDSEKQISSRAQAMIEVLNQQISALAPPARGAGGRARCLGEARQGFADAHRRARPAAERRAGAARAGAGALSFGILRPPARDPRQPVRHPHRRRPLRVPVGSVLRRRSGRAQAGRARRARSARRCARGARAADPRGNSLGAADRRPHRRAADRQSPSFHPTGSCRPRAPSRWCST